MTPMTPNTMTPNTTPPMQPWAVPGMNNLTRIATAMHELAVLLPVEFPDMTPAPSPEVPHPASVGGVISTNVTVYEVSVQVSATVLVDAAMTGKVVCVDTREVYHYGPDKPATLHYTAWLPYLLSESKYRVKVTACEEVGGPRTRTPVAHTGHREA